MNFSFSGLKTAVRYTIAGGAENAPDATKLDDKTKSDIAASFEQAVIDCVVAKCKLALKSTGLKRLCVGGGVAANPKLRQALDEMSQRLKAELVIADTSLCTDNAVMGAIAWERVLQGDFDGLDLDVTRGLCDPDGI